MITPAIPVTSGPEAEKPATEGTPGIVVLPGSDNGFLSLKILARALAVHPRTITRAVASGGFPKPSRIGRERLWPRKAIQAHLENPKIDNADDIS